MNRVFYRLTSLGENFNILSQKGQNCLLFDGMKSAKNERKFALALVCFCVRSCSRSWHVKVIRSRWRSSLVSARSLKLWQYHLNLTQNKIIFCHIQFWISLTWLYPFNIIDSKVISGRHWRYGLARWRHQFRVCPQYGAVLGEQAYLWSNKRQMGNQR